MSAIRSLRRPRRRTAAVAAIKASTVALAAVLFACGVSVAGAAPTQITFHDGNCATSSPSPNAAGTLIAFASTCDWTGQNPDGNREIFQSDDNGVVTQLTFTEGCTNANPSSDLVGDVVAFDSDCDIAANADRNVEIFLASAGTVTQITDSLGCTSLGASLNAVGDLVAFDSDCDLVGSNPDASIEVYRATASGVATQITSDTSGTGCVSMHASSNASGDEIAFESDCDLTGSNPDQINEIFQFSGGVVNQRTISGDDPCINASPSSSEDGSLIAFESDCNLTGGNPDFSTEIVTVDRDGVITQVTGDPGTAVCESFGPHVTSHIEGGVLTFTGYCDPLHQNGDGSFEVFSSSNGALAQLTDGDQCLSVSPALIPASRSAVYVSTCDPEGLNPDGNAEIFVVGLCACGAAVSRDPAQPVASDALFTLRTAVGSARCALCDCDVSGDLKITASDALLTLKKAVGQNVTVACP